MTASGTDLRSSTPKGLEGVVLPTTTIPKVPENSKVLVEPEEAVGKYEPSPIKGKDFESATKRLSVFKPDDRPLSPRYEFFHS